MTKQQTAKTLHSSGGYASALACLGLALAGVAHAAVNVGDVQIGGFFSQGYLKSTENNYPIDTEDGTADFREMGINASTNLTSRLRVGAQLFAQKLGKYGDDKVILDWAVADYNFRPEIGVRVGRVKYPRSLHSEVLDLDVVRPFILLPQALYDARLRDFQKSFDGGMVYGTLAAGENSVDYKVFYGDIPMKTDGGVADFFNNSPLFDNPPGTQRLEVDSVHGAALTWSPAIAGLRIGLNFSELRDMHAAGPMLGMPVFGADITLTRLRYHNLSIEYALGAWTFTGEYLLGKGRSVLALPAILGVPPSASDYGNKSYYVSIARRLGTRFEVGTYFTEGRNSYKIAPGPVNYRRDLAVAVRFDYSEHLLFKLEAHAINGTMDMFHVPGISNPPAALKDSMALFAAKTTLSF